MQLKLMTRKIDMLHIILLARVVDKVATMGLYWVVDMLHKELLARMVE